MICENNKLIFSKSRFGVIKEPWFEKKNWLILHLHAFASLKRAFKIGNENLHLHLEIGICICIMSIYNMKCGNLHLHIYKGHLHWKTKFDLALCLECKKKCLQKEEICIWGLSLTFLGQEYCIGFRKDKDIWN